MPANRHRIMIIDDSALIQRIIEGILRREGYQVSSFNHGPEAMEALAMHRVDVPDLVFMDIGLPLMDGYTAARLFRQKDDFDQTVIVMISGNDGMFDKIRGRMAGAKAYITKPFKPGEILDVVHQFLHDAPALTR
ncbi:MAG: response regulator [Ktedonobacterales bacterium]|nr:response regulator [Ktedonobacterales bacterium]